MANKSSAATASCVTSAITSLSPTGTTDLSARPAQAKYRWCLSRCKPRALWAQAIIIQLVSVLCILWVGPDILQSALLFELQQSLPLPFLSALPILYIACVAHLLCVTVGAALWQMPSWWRVLHVLFPLAVVSLQQVSIPADVYFVGFLITLSVYWSVHRTRVPFYPSFPATWQACIAAIQAKAGDRPQQVLDIGSGIGDAAFYFAQCRPQDRVAGIEIAPLPWLISVVRGYYRASRIDWLRGDYRHLHFAHYDVIFAYLSPAVMAAVGEKARQEMRPGSVLLSCEFPIPHLSPQQVIPSQAGTPALFVYRF